MVKEWLEELSQIFNERAPIARLFGMKLEYDDNGSAIVDLPYNSSLDHAMGGVHGGVYATMLDCAGWFTVAAAHETPNWFVTSELTIRYLVPVSGKSLRAVGRVIKQGRRQDVAEMQLFDEDGELVGHATGTFVLINNDKMPELLVGEEG